MEVEKEVSAPPLLLASVIRRVIGVISRRLGKEPNFQKAKKGTKNAPFPIDREKCDTDRQLIF